MKKILVVDDEKVIGDALSKFLARKGYHVTTAQSGEEAIEKVKKEKPHMILLDIMMPGMSGVETLKRIKEIDKEVGIVMITAVNEDDIGRKCMELGAYDYIIKPLNIEYLEAVLMTKLLACEE